MGGGVSSQYPRKRSLFTVVPIPQSSNLSWRVFVLFSANDMPKRVDSAFGVAHVERARDSVAALAF